VLGLAVKDALEKIKKTVEEISSDFRESREKIRDTIEAVRPRPIKRIIERRFRPLFKKRERE